MIKKKTNSFLQGLNNLKKVISLKPESNLEKNDEDVFDVGICPKCNKMVLEGDGVYGCVGRLSGKCDFMAPTVFENEKISFEEIMKIRKYQKMIDSGFLDNANENNVSTNSTVSTSNDKVETQIETETERKNQVLGSCPKCKGDVIYKNSKYSCCNCDYKLNSTFSKTKIEPPVVETLLKGEHTDWMQFTRKDGNKYKSRLMLDNKNYNYALVPYKKSIPENMDKIHNVEENEKKSNLKNKESLGKCPVCNKDIITGNNAFGCFGLTNKTCTFKIPFKFNDMSIDSQEIVKLLKGETISKKDSNKEEVFLKIDANGMLQEVPF